MAWSEPRIATVADTVALNCGQGIECGFGSPDVNAVHCLSTANLVGARFGDNYDWDYDGFLRVTNSLLLYNYRDVWGMDWDTTYNGDWNYRADQMDVRGNYLTAPNTYHPNNAIWNPATDAWRLASFMSTPPDAPVGVGLAAWTNQFAMSALFNGVPVRLSSFTTNEVSVGYVFEDAGGATLATGVYLVRFRGDGVTRSHKLVVAR